jgi:hypothetical protein
VCSAAATCIGQQKEKLLCCPWCKQLIFGTSQWWVRLRSSAKDVAPVGSGRAGRAQQTVKSNTIRNMLLAAANRSEGICR